MSDDRMKPNPGKTTPHRDEHYFVSACVRQQCEPMAVIDKAGFSDKWAWGYCEFCAFQVACDRLGMLLPHNRAVGAGASAVAVCRGGGTAATLQPSLEAKPRLTWYALEEDEDGDEDDTDTSGGD